MTWLKRLFGLFSSAPPRPEAPGTPAPGSNRLHLFAGHFGTELAATAYVFDAPDANHPEPFTNDLPDAFVDPDCVEIAHGSRFDPILAMITGADADRLREEAADADTLLIVSEDAFGGLPFSLNDTPRARYLGVWEMPR